MAKTTSEIQRNRREREKKWLRGRGFNSWEAIHTALLRGILFLAKSSPKKENKK